MAGDQLQGETLSHKSMCENVHKPIPLLELCALSDLEFSLLFRHLCHSILESLLGPGHFPTSEMLLLCLVLIGTQHPI